VPCARCACNKRARLDVPFPVMLCLESALLCRGDKANAHTVEFVWAANCSWRPVCCVQLSACVIQAVVVELIGMLFFYMSRFYATPDEAARAAPHTQEMAMLHFEPQLGACCHPSRSTPVLWGYVILRWACFKEAGCSL